MEKPDFWDFILEGGYDLLFADEEEEEGKMFPCPSCKEMITEDDDVVCKDEKLRVFECPHCHKDIILE